MFKSIFMNFLSFKCPNVPLMTMVAALSLWQTGSFAQDVHCVLNAANFPVSGDTLLMKEVKYIDAGNGGDSALWDFRSVEWTENTQNEFFCSTDTNRLLRIGQMFIEKYSLQHDTLFQIGLESPLNTIDYTTPIPVLYSPFEFGDTLVKDFLGEGTYCQKYHVQTYGTIQMIADGEGRLVLTEGDTLRNVLRIHTLKTSSIGMQLLSDTTEIAPDRFRQEIVDKYQWYVKGNRYPVFEKTSTASYNNLELISCIQNASCSIIQPMIQVGYDEEGADSESSVEPAFVPIINYDVSINGGIVTVSYRLSESVPLTALVCNRLGYVYHSLTTSNDSDTDYSLAIDCSGLSSDVYILYLNVGGQVFSEKIDLR